MVHAILVPEIVWSVANEYPGGQAAKDILDFSGKSTRRRLASLASDHGCHTGHSRDRLSERLA